MPFCFKIVLLATTLEFAQTFFSSSSLNVSCKLVDFLRLLRNGFGVQTVINPLNNKMLLLRTTA